MLLPKLLATLQTAKTNKTSRSSIAFHKPLMLHGWASSGNLGAWCAKAGGAHSSKEGNDTCRGWKCCIAAWWRNSPTQGIWMIVLSMDDMQKLQRLYTASMDDITWYYIRYTFYMFTSNYKMKRELMYMLEQIESIKSCLRHRMTWWNTFHIFSPNSIGPCLQRLSTAVRPAIQHSFVTIHLQLLQYFDVPGPKPL